jgi:hypothetical protein
MAYLGVTLETLEMAFELATVTAKQKGREMEATLFEEKASCCKKALFILYDTTLELEEAKCHEYVRSIIAEVSKHFAHACSF